MYVVYGNCFAILTLRVVMSSILLWVAIPTFSPVGNFRVSFQLVLCARV